MKNYIGRRKQQRNICLLVLLVLFTYVFWLNFRTSSTTRTCILSVSNYTATCNFPGDIYLSEVDCIPTELKKLLQDSKRVKLIRFADGQELYQGCTRHTKRCKEKPHFNETLNLTMNLPPCCRRNLVKLYKEVVDLFEQYNINYSLIGGSVLGLVRHHGHMIPYDDDIDIMVAEEHREMFKTVLVPILTRNGRHVHEVPSNKYQTHVEVSKHNVLTVDLFWYRFEPDSKIFVKDYSSKVPKYDASLFFPLRREWFEGRPVPVPSDPMEFVRKRFGKNWRVMKDCRKRLGHKCV